MTDVIDQRPPPPVAVVVTSPRESNSCFTYTPINLLTPAWARDEPPSPTEQIGSATQQAESRIFSDASSLQSNRITSNPASRWWSFTLRTRQESFGLLPHSIRPEKKSFRDTSLAWMPPSSSMHHEGHTFIRRDEPDAYPPQLQIPDPSSAQPHITAITPWDIPWSSPSQPSARDPFPQLRRGSPYVSGQDVVTTSLSKWSRRKKKIRSFLIANTYAPLVRLSFISPLQNLH